MLPHKTTMEILADMRRNNFAQQADGGYPAAQPVVPAPQANNMLASFRNGLFGGPPVPAAPAQVALVKAEPQAQNLPSVDDRLARLEASQAQLIKDQAQLKKDQDALGDGLETVGKGTMQAFSVFGNMMNTNFAVVHNHLRGSGVDTSHMLMCEAGAFKTFDSVKPVAAGGAKHAIVPPPSPAPPVDVAPASDRNAEIKDMIKSLLATGMDFNAACTMAKELTDVPSSAVAGPAAGTKRKTGAAKTKAERQAFLQELVDYSLLAVDSVEIKTQAMTLDVTFLRQDGELKAPKKNAFETNAKKFKLINGSLDNPFKLATQAEINAFIDKLLEFGFCTDKTWDGSGMDWDKEPA